MAAAVMAASSSGVGQMVPGLSFGIAKIFPWVGFAQTDNPFNAITFDKNHEVQAQPYISDAQHSCLAIIVPVILLNQRRFPLHMARFGQRNTVFRPVGGVLGGIEGDFYRR